MDRTPPIISIVPGYKGYRDKENRRDSDKRIREAVAERLGQAAARVERVATDLANKREIMAVASVDAGAKAVRHLQNQIATATYGYGGLWGDRPIDSAALDQIAQFDADLLTQVDALDVSISQVESATDLTAREAALLSLRSATDALQSRFDERKHVVETGAPSAPSTATAPLTGGPGESTKPLPPAAFNLDMGDQLVIRGQQAAVTAKIDVTGDQPMRLFRIGANPARWLIVNERFVADTTAAEIVPSGTGATANGEALVLHGGGSGIATMTGLGALPDQQPATFQVYGGASAQGAFALTLSWGTTGLSLVGRGVPIDDIEIPEQMI